MYTVIYFLSLYIYVKQIYSRYKVYFILCFVYSQRAGNENLLLKIRVHGEIYCEI